MSLGKLHVLDVRCRKLHLQKVKQLFTKLNTRKTLTIEEFVWSER